MSGISIYEKSIKKIREGYPFSVNLKKRTLKIDGKTLISPDKDLPDLYPSYLDVMSINFIDMVENLYDKYYNSVPSERTSSRRKSHFIALPLERISDDDMLYGERRDIAQFNLEFYLLSVIISGKLEWKDFAGDKWFWQSPNHPSLIIYRKWFENN